MSKPRPLRRILQDQANLSSNRKAGNCLHALVVRLPFADSPFRQVIPDLPTGVKFLGPESLSFVPTLHPFGDTLALFATDQALYAGQPAGLLIGHDLDELRYYLSRISYTPDTGSENKTDAEPRLYKQRTLNIDDARSLLNQAEHRIETRLHFEHMPLLDIEDRSVLAWVDHDGLVIECTHPWPHLIRRIASEATGLPQRSVVVRLGTSHHLKFSRVVQGIIPCALAAIAAHHLHERVLLHWPAAENIRYNFPQAAASFRILSAHNTLGELQALRVHVDYQMGACVIAADEILSQSLLAFLGTYQSVPMELKVQLHSSPYSPCFFGDSFGEQMVQEAMEQHWNQVARSFEQSPLIWRLEHLRQQAKGPGELCFDDSVHIAQQVLLKVSNMADFSRHFSSYSLLNQTLRKRIHETRSPTTWGESYHGIGLALGYQSGNLLSLEHSVLPRVALTLESDGHLLVEAALEPGNTSVRDGWVRMLEENLKHSERDMAFIPLQASDENDPGPLILGRQYSVISPLLASACRQLQIERVKGTSPCHVEVNRLPTTAPGWDGSRLAGTPFERRTWGAAVIDLIFRHDLGIATIRRIWLCVHVGFVMHEVRARSILSQGIREILMNVLGLNPEQVHDSIIEIQILPGESDHPEGLVAMEGMGGMESIPALLIPTAYCNALAHATNKPVECLPPSEEDYMGRM